MRKTKKQGREEVKQKAVEILARTRRRARSNRNCVFLLSQVSHGGEVRKERWGVQQKGRRKIAFFKGATLGF